SNRPATIDVQLLAINDFHGNLEPPAGSSALIDGVLAGGAAYLAAHIAALRAASPAPTFVVSAGDIVGASPLLSALFHDEPSIEPMTMTGVGVRHVAHQESDGGIAELRRLRRGAVIRSTAATPTTCSRGLTSTTWRRTWCAARTASRCSEATASSGFPPGSGSRSSA